VLSAEGLEENIRMKLYLDGKRQIERKGIFGFHSPHQFFAQKINNLTDYNFCANDRIFLLCMCTLRSKLKLLRGRMKHGT